MEHSRFVVRVIRGPPECKGVFAGFQPRKDALCFVYDAVGKWSNPAQLQWAALKGFDGSNPSGVSTETKPRHWIAANGRANRKRGFRPRSRPKEIVALVIRACQGEQGHDVRKV